MPDYKQGKIYAIRSHQTDQIYIGSTTNPLHKRLYKHRKDYEYKKLYVSSFEILKYDDNYIELIEMFQCNNRMELRKREGEIIREHNNCVNKRIEGRTIRQWKEDNKEDRKQKNKIYYETNKEQISNQKKQYNEKHKEYFKELSKKYQEKNKEKIRENNSILIECGCGCMISKSHMKRHTRTEKHQSIIDKVGLNVFGY